MHYKDKDGGIVMADISSTFKSILKQKYSSIQDTSVNHGNAQISADHNVENIDLSLTSPPSNNKYRFKLN